MSHSPRISIVRRIAWAAAILVVAALVWGCYQTFWGYHTKRFQVVREGVLYRIGQPTELGMEYLVRKNGIKTVVSLQLFDYRLHKGWFDINAPDGARESEFVSRLGVRHVQWPMGDEACWPWPTPWQFESFFKLFDDPANLPVLIHCMGGRHRTGTLAALYRMEYDRWPAEQAIAEMKSFDFGICPPIQEHNLRTYLPRPQPTSPEWLFERRRRISRHYEEYVRQLRAARSRLEVTEELVDYLRRDQPFAVPLAQRLIDSPDDPLAGPATEAAEALLGCRDASVAEWQMSAALIADFGSPQQQERLLSLLREEVRESKVSLRYAALVAGVASRYTANRIPFFLTMLDDDRQHIEPAASKYRYCDTAVARLESITDVKFLHGMSDTAWNEARTNARQWLAEHPAFVALGRLVPPEGNKMVRADDGSNEGDLSRLK